MSTTTVSPEEKRRKDIEYARSSLNSLMDEVQLTRIRNEVSTLDAEISNLPSRVEKIRGRNYAFNKILEPQSLDLQKQWTLKRGGILSHITFESNTLQNLLLPLERRVAALSQGSSSQIMIDGINNELSSFESKINAAENAAREMYSGLDDQFTKFQAQLTRIEQTLDWGESASFGFLPVESLVMAVKAVWTRDQKEDREDPDGILFLTDQRLIFEQREEIATKKVLFITTERQKIQQLLFEVPVFSITQVNAVKQGLFKNEDWLDLQFESGSFAREAKLHLNGQDCSFWQQMITQVKNHELDDDRVIALDQAAVDKARSAPEKCPNCGGAITKPVLRGMDSITCEFCGNKIRL